MASLARLIDDLQECLTKEEVRDDTYTTEAEAIARARAIGCSGMHSIDEDGTVLYMPCESHDEYLEVIGTETAQYDYDEDGKKKPKRKKSDCSCDDEFSVMQIAVPCEIKMGHDEEKEDEGRFEGYASIFGNTDLGNDVIVKGAFRKTLRRTGVKGVKLLYQHKTDMPIGVFEKIREDEKGLHVQGKLALGTQAGREVYELMKMGALDGMSIGFRTNPKGHHYDAKTKRRMINELELMEISVVTFPMNPKAKVEQVKGADMSIREWENGLRDAFNLSRSEAKMAAKAVESVFSKRDACDEEDANAILNLTQKLKEFRR
jgi:HK97 family phage prohead protease